MITRSAANGHTKQSTVRKLETDNKDCQQITIPRALRKGMSVFVTRSDKSRSCFCAVCHCTSRVF